jgi:hypothetical protein
MIDWNIQSRAHICQACQRRFADKEKFHTLLFSQRQLYERLDVCETCWSSQYSQGATDRKGFVSHWHGLYSAPAPAQPDAIQKENAESLLRKIFELKDPRHAAALFILAVMLERKRLFKVKAQLRENSGRVFVYEHAASGDLFTIPDPNLQLDELDQVQRDVAQLLEHGIELSPLNVESSSQPEAALGGVSESAPEMAPEGKEKH